MAVRCYTSVGGDECGTCGLVSSTGFSHTSRAGHKGASGARCLLIKPSSKTLRALRRKLEGKPEQKASVRRGKVAFCCQNRRDGLSAPKHHPRRLFQFSALIAAGRQQQQRQKKIFHRDFKRRSSFAFFPPENASVDCFNGCNNSEKPSIPGQQRTESAQRDACHSVCGQSVVHSFCLRGLPACLAPFPRPMIPIISIRTTFYGIFRKSTSLALPLCRVKQL